MDIFSAEWFYNLAAFAERHPRLCSPQLVEVFCQVANEIDERNGVIPPVQTKAPYNWQTQEALDSVYTAAVVQLQLSDPPEFHHNRVPDRKPCGCKLICVKYADRQMLSPDLFCTEEATKYRRGL